VFPGTGINANHADNEEAGSRSGERLALIHAQSASYSQPQKRQPPKSDSNLNDRDFNA
jgi:hypothetical protein